ncbi:MAG: glycoside hydrolase family 44 protein [Bacteroidota bacterium]|nr:glycoside hydrolase family 44 protein [Bacteroidota bacterium]
MKKQLAFRKLHLVSLAIGLLMSVSAWSQSVTISVDAAQNKRLISPSIYGKNDDLANPVQFYIDAGLHFSRMNHGNNATGYNWRKKITVSPDWFNNVYAEDWDAKAQNINSNYSSLQGMFAFQLLGRVASNTNNNFNDWAYMQAHPGFNGFNQNLAGGGTPDPAGGSKALVDGDINLFTQPWPADSSVAILTHWFGANGLGLNPGKFVYWNMDNEVDVWNGTHDYAMPTLISASAFMDRYIELAKKAKALYPGIKLCGPVATSEWQWYKWSSESIYINGRYYPWIEYFIKRLGDEYKATGIKLVDVVDIHNYPFYNNNTEALQGHRIYYDTTYVYPGSNGIYTSTGGWDTSLKQQYIFKRINGWLNEEFGVNHGITTGVSEWATMTTNSNPNIESVIYASHLGTFANNGVELFSPWSWSIGMWETLHLFKNAKQFSVSSTSSAENTVSAYSSVNQNADSLTVILVNRDMTTSQTVTVNLSNFNVSNGNYKTLQLSSLPSTETFVSETQNALKSSTVAVNSNSLTITVPALSTTAILLLKSVPPTVTYSTLKNVATSLLADGMYRYTDGSTAGQWGDSGSDAQQWVIETVGSYVKIKNKASGLYLDGLGSSTNGSVVAQKVSSTSNNQQWQQVATGTNFKFKNRTSGLYIDGMGYTTNGSNLCQYKRSSNNNQVWTVTTLAGPQLVKSVATEVQPVENTSDNVLIYPTSFTSTFNVKVDNPSDVVRIAVYDKIGKEVESVSSSSVSSLMIMGASLKPDLYIVRVQGVNWAKSFKVIKRD